MANLFEKKVRNIKDKDGVPQVGAWQRAGPAGRTTCAAVRLWGAEERSPYGSEELELRI